VTLPVQVHFTSEFASLMLAEPVAFALFDDGDSNPDAFIGRGSLSLAPLLESNQLHVTIPLTAPDGTPAPSLEVSVLWVLPALPSSPVLSPVARQGAAAVDMVPARAAGEAGRGMSDSLGSFSATLLKLQVSSSILSEEELTCFFGVFIFPGETEKEALAHASATKAKAGGWVTYGQAPILWPTANDTALTAFFSCKFLILFKVHACLFFGLAAGDYYSRWRRALPCSRRVAGAVAEENRQASEAAAALLSDAGSVR
jgi:hypothetical protein